MKTDYPEKCYGNIYELNHKMQRRFSEYPKDGEFDNVEYVRTDTIASSEWHDAKDKPSTDRYVLAYDSETKDIVIAYCYFGFSRRNWYRKYDGKRLFHVEAWTELPTYNHKND